MKFETQFIQVGERPTFIVGQNPGRQRRKTLLPGFAWDGNPSADLLLEAIEGLENLVLTNVWQYHWEDSTEELIYEGTNDLQHMMRVLEPGKVIALGQLAYEACCAIYLSHTPPIARLEHPSYICRFKRDRADWIHRLRREIEE